MRFEPTARMKEFFGGIIAWFRENRIKDDEMEFERNLDNYLENLVYDYPQPLLQFIKYTKQEMAEGGRLKDFGESQYWPVFRELLDNFIFNAAVGNINMRIDPKILKDNSALANAALAIQAAVDDHLDYMNLCKFMIEKIEDSNNRVRMKRQLKER